MNKMLLALVIAPLLGTLALAADAPWPFFAFDNGVGRGKYTPEQQAALLKDIGYAGIGYTGCSELPARFKAFDDAGLKVFSLYVNAKVSPQGPTYDPALPEAIKFLKGRDTQLWLTITGKAPDADEQSVKVVRELADLAQQSNLKVTLYPHAGFHVATMQDGLRIVKLVDRKNVGTTFNLCHFLKTDKAANLPAVLKEAAPHLNLVSINGVDEGNDWKQLIQPLGQGKFDVGAVLQQLRSLGYAGPVGLQCYQVPGEPKDILTSSMVAWKRILAALPPMK